MLIYPNIDPVAIDLGIAQIHWYGIMYLIAFAAAWQLALLRAPRAGFKKQQVGDLIFNGALGVILGGRIGYIFFYNFSAFLDNPAILIRIWEGGMSFHGGLIGVVLAVLFTARRQQKTFASVMDFCAPIVPIGLGAGRIGNFIGGELWGRPTDLPWGMVFPHVDNLARHPSQLYQMALEGIVLFTLVWVFSSKPRASLQVSGLFLLVYGMQRFAIEFVRQPDAHLNFVAFGWMTQGQVLSIPMMLLGAYFVLRKQVLQSK